MKTALFVAWFAVCSGDAITTHVALGRGAHEQLLTQSAWANDAIVGGEAVGVALVVHHLRTDHPKLARGLLVGAIAIRSYVVVRNLQTLQKLEAR